MRGHALVFRMFGVFAFVFGAAACAPETDYVTMTRGVQCGLSSRLMRQGFPESLDVLIISDSCVATFRPDAPGPELGAWIAFAPSPFTDCDGPIPILFWTQTSTDGMLATVTFCPTYCASLKAKIKAALATDECETTQNAAGSGGALAPAPTAGAVAPAPMAGAVAPVGGAAASSGGAGAAGSSI